MAKTFRIGGIHPHDRKISAGVPITVVLPPSEVVITLAQHIGAPAEAVVGKGDKVRVGTLLGKATGFVSANIHSSVSGTVTKVDQIVDASGFKKPAIYINVEGDEWEDYIDQTDTLITQTDLDSKQIVDRIAEMGIVGMGGATFPTHVKLSLSPGQTADYLIINAVECEPYLTSDDALMRVKAMEIMVGCALIMRATKAPKTLIGIENNKPEAIRTMRDAAERAKEFLPADQSISIIPLKKRYPQGGEKQLIDALIRKQVASGALPISTGAIVQNVGTTFAIYEAVMKHKPLIERIITVTGRAVAHPSNFKARIGTPMQTLIDAAGGYSEEPGKIIGGGPMMGRTLSSTEIPVAKGSSGLLVFTAKESTRPDMYDCIRCGKCVSVCPMGLNPAFLMRDTIFKDWETTEHNYIVDCIECGSCSYTCPAGRPLLDYIRIGKQTVMGIMRARKK